VLLEKKIGGGGLTKIVESRRGRRIITFALSKEPLLRDWLRCMGRSLSGKRRATYCDHHRCCCCCRGENRYIFYSFLLAPKFTKETSTRGT
jgi:hypothetical protein